jgi:hypothetical protein
MHSSFELRARNLVGRKSKKFTAGDQPQHSSVPIALINMSRSLLKYVSLIPLIRLKKRYPEKGKKTIIILET